MSNTTKPAPAPNVASTTWDLARDAAERYQQVLVPSILGPAARLLVEHCCITVGQAAVDVGCGTGAATRPMAERLGSSGRAIGVDVNADMLAVAERLTTAAGAPITWRQGDAIALPLPDADVDIVLCAQTLQFVTAPQIALTEMCRVLKPGGRLAVSLWSPLHRNPYFQALIDAVDRHIGPNTAQGLKAAFKLSDSDVIRALADDAPWRDPQLSTRRFDLSLPRLREFVPRHIGATPMAAGYAAAPAATRETVVNEVCERLAEYETDSDARLPFEMYLLTAVR